MNDIVFRGKISSSLKHVQDEYRKILATPTAITSKSDVITVQTLLQTLFGVKFNEPIQQAIHDLIIEHALQSERLAPDGLICFLRGLVQERQLSHGESTVTHRLPRRCDVETYLRSNSLSTHDYLSTLVLDALDLAGMTGKIIVEKTHSVDHIEHVNGHVFSLTPVMSTQFLRHVRPFVTCIDAFVESVSQLDSYLQDVVDCGRPCLLFGRGFSDEVVETIRTNVEQRRFQLMLYRVPVDFETVNTLVDVAVVAGVDVLSTFKGDLISSLRLDRTPVDRVDVLKHHVIIHNSRTKYAVAVHRRNMLQHKVRENEHVAKLYDNRIKSMTSNVVYVRLLDDPSFVVKSQFVDGCLRAVRSMIEHGIDERHGGPALSIDVAGLMLKRFYGTFDSLGAVVTSVGQDRPRP